MPKKIVAFQSTTLAFVNPPEHCFSTVSEHTTEAAANKALAKDKAEQLKLHGPGAWSHNTRIIALCDLEFNGFCCDCGASLGKILWPKGETKPNPYRYCDKCADWNN